MRNPRERPVRWQWVVAVWLIVLAAGIVTLGTTVERLDARFTFPGAPGYLANVAIEEHYGNGGDSNPIVPVVTLPEGSTVDDPPIAAALGDAYGTLESQGLRGVSYPQTGDRAFVSADGRTVFGVVFKPFVRLSAEDAGARRAEYTAMVTSAFRAVLPATAEVGVTGLDQLAQDFDDGGTDEGGDAAALTETLLGAAGALIVLAFVFGSLLALLPLLVAAVSILSGFLVVRGLTYVTGIADLVTYVLAFVGLGVAIDYALLFVTRWREERDAGHDNETALRRTMATAGRSIVVSGTTVAVGLVVLAVLPSPALRSLALGGILVPVFSVLVTLTLLPALLRAAGPRLDWPRRRTRRTGGRLWQRWAGAVIRRRWLAAGLAMVLLVPLTVVAFSLRLGDPPSTALAQGGDGTTAVERLDAAGVPRGVLTPIEVLVPRAAEPDEVAAQLSEVDGVYAVAAPTGAAWRIDGLAVVTVLPAEETLTPQGQQTVAAVRDTMAATQPDVLVGGSGPQLADEIDAEYGMFPLLLVLVALAAFVVLTRAFRSVVLAAQGVLLNLLSVGAAYGVLVLVWQEGHGSELVWGIPALGNVSSFVPLLTFAFLFGLSMDYEVFLISRMREEYDATGSTDSAIVVGLGRVGRLVTSAALILFLAFASLAGLPEVHAKVMATGLGAAILIDATVLRMLLLPALVAITGRWTWWLPDRLARVLRVPRDRPLT